MIRFRLLFPFSIRYVCPPRCLDSYRISTHACAAACPSTRQLRGHMESFCWQGHHQANRIIVFFPRINEQRADNKEKIFVQFISFLPSHSLTCLAAAAIPAAICLRIASLRL